MVVDCLKVLGLVGGVEDHDHVCGEDDVDQYVHRLPALAVAAETDVPRRHEAREDQHKRNEHIPEMLLRVLRVNDASFLIEALRHPLNSLVGHIVAEKIHRLRVHVLRVVVLRRRASLDLFVLVVLAMIVIVLLILAASLIASVTRGANVLRGEAACVVVRSWISAQKRRRATVTLFQQGSHSLFVFLQ